MPILPDPNYLPPIPFRSAHLATIYPPLFRPTPPGEPARERIETPDGDFLDIDRHRSRAGATRKLAVINHGLEGHSRKKYVLGMARTVTGLGYDAACWVQRGAGKELNRKVRSYHSGETDDLHTVISHCLKSGYDQVVLIGFSMGGNQILKYLGEAPDRVPCEVMAAATFSVPVDLAASERVIALPSRRIYFEYFMKGLRKRIRAKAEAFPGEVNPAGLKGIRTLRQFDDFYTAPVNGYADAANYYAKASSRQFLGDIRIPTLLVNALDDPFLGPECYPTREAEGNENLFLEMPKHGGHVGFITAGPDNVYWSESRAARFLKELAY
ncbi:alpha/beta fold hydrolase [Pseudodesulfovibrio cashew]|uniref:Alpha/beta fold hydrolase n=1 Tax=Pseudodesulfovibrio cashew TaxID=2678688 RepID=A0A6I6JNH2_9BACT|nr:alpha/beta fold hydrolase [Pseudodesulfovibrio cashew]QGY41687.1 alpha/beta fold hydrolase [Pseudodesulfovibrio cashew]